MGHGLLDLVYQDQAEVTWRQARQSGINGHELAAELINSPSAAGALQPLAQQCQHFAIGPASLTSVFK